ncbi:hypothetical protein EJB05_48598, partial [Eragrostis curvula]
IKLKSTSAMYLHSGAIGSPGSFRDGFSKWVVRIRFYPSSKTQNVNFCPFIDPAIPDDGNRDGHTPTSRTMTSASRPAASSATAVPWEARGRFHPSPPPPPPPSPFPALPPPPGGPPDASGEAEDRLANHRRGAAAAARGPGPRSARRARERRRRLPGTARRRGAEAEAEAETAKGDSPRRRGAGAGRQPAAQRRRRRWAGKGLLPEREDATALESARSGVAGSIFPKLVEGPS